MDPKSARIVVVGAGQAGASLVARLRSLGHFGPITMIGAEPNPPYQRPPLSKAYLKGEMPRERLQLRPASFFAQEDIRLQTGVRVVRIDRAAKMALTDDGGSHPYDLLALTTGAAPRRWPEAAGGNLVGVLTMRTVADADALAMRLTPGSRALVVGGGYIGLEAAAVLAEAQLTVTVIERESRILSRVAAPETSYYFRNLHRAHGVAIREGVTLTRLTGESGAVTCGELASGAMILADVVLIGIGVAPETGLAADAGLEIENGVRVDAAGRTSDPSIFAAGDCASFPWRGGRVRLESVPNAIEHGEAVAAAMLGEPVEYVARPWFWSDQYDVKLQIAGLNAGHERVIVRPGTRKGAQSVWYWRGPELIAVDAMNDPRAYMTGKRWIELGLSPNPALLADPGVDLRSLD